MKKGDFSKKTTYTSKISENQRIGEVTTLIKLTYISISVRNRRDLKELKSNCAHFTGIPKIVQIIRKNE